MSWSVAIVSGMYVLGWALCLLMLYVVPRKRDPESAGGWLLFSFFFPYLATLLFFLIGSPKLPLARRDRQRAIDETLSGLRQSLQEDPELAHIFTHELEPRRQQIATLVERLGGMVVMQGDVELLDDYTATIDRIAADVEASQRYVHLLYYIFADDECGRKVVDALCRAADRGVACRVLYDGLGNSSYLGQLSTRFQQAGIEAHPVLPLKLFGAKRLRPDLRNHRKIAVIDGQIAYTGSQNITDPTFKPGIVYEELVARLTGPIVAQLAVIFLTDWLSETEVGLPETERPDRATLVAQAGTAPCQVLPSGPAYDTDNISLLFGALLFAAQ
ncbi:MAG TPA: phospholipase D-like domain-containing protein, partial [Roseiflexaceae bacterium]|nr:phospholipase D-like domain-containing protein [Roseiflexaceae bacterium]